MSTGSVPHSAPTPEHYASPPLTIILTVILLVVLFVGFFSIFFCRCFMQNLLYTWHMRHSPAETPIATTGPTCAQGLDTRIIESFPTFTYSSVKDYRKEKYGLECAICLVEFGEDDILRLLTSCCHVFHQECIDLWLESHKTCPACRRSLDTAILSPEKSPRNNNAMHDINENEFLADSYSITIKDDNEDERGGNDRGERAASGNADQVKNPSKIEKFSRCKSTGHSIVRITKEEQDRFTLRLPEHIKANIIRGHNSTRSCTTFGEFQTEKTAANGGFGEVSWLPTEDIKKL